MAVVAGGVHWVLETKGAETVEVAYKDQAARIWCDNATQLTGTTWDYLKVAQRAFLDMQPADFADLLMMR